MAKATATAAAAVAAVAIRPTTATLPKQHAPEHSVPSGCQACALQIPSFFCNLDCDGEGGILAKPELLPRHPGDQEKISSHHPVKPESYMPTIDIYDSTYYTDTDIMVDGGTPTAACSESPFNDFGPRSAEYLPPYNGSLDMLYSPEESSTRPGRQDNNGFVEADRFAFSYQNPYQSQYPMQTRSPATNYQPHDTVGFGQWNEAWPESSISPNPQESHAPPEPAIPREENNQELRRMGNIIQDLAQMDGRFSHNIKEQLRAIKRSRHR